MKKLRLVVYDKALRDAILINHKNINFVKGDEKRSYYAVIETEKYQLDLEILPFHPYLAKRWFLKEMILFLVSIFGIFSPKALRTESVVQYKGIVYLDEEDNTLKVRRFFGEDKAFKLEGAKVTDIENKRIKNPEIGKRRKKLNLAKAGVIVGVILLGILAAVIAIIS